MVSLRMGSLPISGESTASSFGAIRGQLHLESVTAAPRFSQSSRRPGTFDACLVKSLRTSEDLFWIARLQA